MRALWLVMLARRLPQGTALCTALALVMWVLPLEPLIVLDSSVSVPPRPVSAGELGALIAAAVLPGILHSNVNALNRRPLRSRLLAQYAVTILGATLPLLPALSYWIRFHQTTPQVDTHSLMRFMTTAAAYSAIGVVATRAAGPELGPPAALMTTALIPLTQNYLPTAFVDAHISAGLKGGQLGWQNIIVLLLTGLPLPPLRSRHSARHPALQSKPSHT